MRREIRDLQRRLAITTIYVTHDQEEAMAVSDRIAVMNEGSVVQQGTAEDLYHRPASEFVARFVGRVNLVAGRVAEIVGDTAKIAALGTVIRARSAPEGLAPGDPVQLILRPEAIEVGRSTDGSAPVDATVVSRMFLGEKIEYLLRCEGELLQMVCYNAGPRELIADGAVVSLRFAEDAVTVLPVSGA